MVFLSTTYYLRIIGSEILVLARGFYRCLCDLLVNKCVYGIWKACAVERISIVAWGFTSKIKQENLFE